MKWYTENIYIDIDTGEIITKNNAVTNYIIIKKIKHGKVIEKWIKRTRTTYGIREIINECTTTGTQRKIW